MSKIVSMVFAMLNKIGNSQKVFPPCHVGRNKKFRVNMNIPEPSGIAICVNFFVA